VPYFGPDEEAWSEHRATLEAHLHCTVVALVTRLDPSRANRPVLPDAVALTH
jgi:hypothetical protein